MSMEWPHPRLEYSGRQASGTGLTYASVRSIQVWISMKWFCARTITRHTIASIHTMDHTMDICIMWVWYPSIILNWIWILVLIRWQASYTSQALEWRLLWHMSHEAQQACKSALIGPICTGGLSHKHHKHDKINGSQRFLNLLSPRLM